MTDASICRQNRAELVAVPDVTAAKFNARADRDRNDTEIRDPQVQDGSSRSSFVVSEKFEQTRIAGDLLARFERVVGLGPTAGVRPVANALMGTARIVEVDVGRHEEIEVLMPKHDEMMEAFVLDRYDPTLNVDVMIGCPWGRRNDSRTRGKQLVVLVGTKRALGLAIHREDTRRRCTALRKRLVDSRPRSEGLRT